MRVRWMVLACVACSGDSFQVDLQIAVEPVTAGDVGAVFDANVPMRMETYPAEVESGRLELEPIYGFVMERVENVEVDCMDAALLEVSLFRDQVAVLFLNHEPTEASDDPYAVTGGIHWERDVQGGGREGSFDAVLDFQTPCSPALVPHRVHLEWIR